MKPPLPQPPRAWMNGRDVKTASDERILTCLLRQGRPHDPVLLGEMVRRGLSARFALLERSVIGREKGLRLQ